MCLPGPARGHGRSQWQPSRLPSSCLGSDASPRASMRGLSEPRRLVPVEPRPLAHSRNLISCDFITGGDRGPSKGGSHLEKYNCLSAGASARASLGPEGVHGPRRSTLANQKRARKTKQKPLFEINSEKNVSGIRLYSKMGARVKQRRFW